MNWLARSLTCCQRQPAGSRLKSNGVIIYIYIVSYNSPNWTKCGSLHVGGWIFFWIGVGPAQSVLLWVLAPGLPCLTRATDISKLPLGAVFDHCSESHSTRSCDNGCGGSEESRPCCSKLRNNQQAIRPRLQTQQFQQLLQWGNRRVCFSSQRCATLLLVLLGVS